MHIHGRSIERLTLLHLWSLLIIWLLVYISIFQPYELFNVNLLFFINKSVPLLPKMPKVILWKIATCGKNARLNDDIGHQFHQTPLVNMPVAY